jgi:hypothetical protein
MRRGRKPKGLEEKLNEYADIEYKFVEDWDSGEVFDDDDNEDLLERMGNYRHLEDLDDEENY